VAPIAGRYRYAHDASIRAVRTACGPALVMCPRRVRDPLEYSVGISPAKPMNARAEANRRQFTTSAARVSPVSCAIPR
jgi:hypothetical protein